MLPCSLLNLASINYNSLILTSNYDPFEALDFWLSNLQNHMWFDSKNSWEVIFDFKLKMMKLGCQGSQIKNFQESFFSLKTPYQLMKEPSRSLLFSFPTRKYAQILCDASDCFHTLHRLQRMIYIYIYIWIFTTKSYTPNI